MAEKKSFLLRIDAGLWGELQAWADDELRSANGQIEYLLREAARVRRKRQAPKARDIPAQREALGERGRFPRKS